MIIKLCCNSFFSAAVKKVQPEIEQDDAEIKAIQDQNVADIMIDYFADDPRHVPDDDGDNEDQTFTLRGLRLDAFINGNRPRQPETSEHNKFKNLHNFYLPFLFSSILYS